jgi:uncharacterized phage-associated protein
MYSASLIAAYFVTVGIEQEVPITQMKLQKMVFFAHGVNLAINDKPLIQETIEAWKYGPVVPILYSNYKLYGNAPICDTDLVYNFPKDDITKINSAELKALMYTWNATKDQTPESLSNWTHKDGSPWKKVYDPNQWAIPIPNNLIKEYFTEFLA